MVTFTCFKYIIQTMAAMQLAPTHLSASSVAERLGYPTMVCKGTSPVASELIATCNLLAAGVGCCIGMPGICTSCTTICAACTHCLACFRRARESAGLPCLLHYARMPFKEWHMGISTAHVTPSWQLVLRLLRMPWQWQCWGLACIVPCCTCSIS